MTESTRQFRSPSGREWIAALYECPLPAVGGGANGVRLYHALRFTSGTLVLDSREFPPEWMDLPDEALIELLRRAQPPALGFAGLGFPSPRDEGASA